MHEHVKLVTTLDDKKKYVVLGRNLKLYLECGMKLKAVYRVLQFYQKAWLKPYIDFNTELRKKAKSDFEKNFFKLMNNSVFGKTIENLRKRVRVDLVKPKEMRRMTRLVASPSYECHNIFESGLIAIHSKIKKLKLNRPIYTGQAVLELSKHLMYSFWYKFLKPLSGDNISLMYTDIYR